LFIALDDMNIDQMHLLSYTDTVYCTYLLTYSLT